MTSVLKRERREGFEDLSHSPMWEGSNVKKGAEWSDASTGKKHQGLWQSPQAGARLSVDCPLELHKGASPESTLIRPFTSQL